MLVSVFDQEQLTHWGRVTHICVSDLTSIGSDNGLSPGRRQAIIRTNAGILLTRPLGTNLREFLVEILIFSFKKMRLKVSSATRWPFWLGLNVLKRFLMWVEHFKDVTSEFCRNSPDDMTTHHFENHTSFSMELTDLPANGKFAIGAPVFWKISHIIYYGGLIYESWLFIHRASKK